MNKFITPFKERKVRALSETDAEPAAIPAGPGPVLHDSPPGYKPAGAGWATSFNRKVKAPVVKTRTKKQGLD